MTATCVLNKGSGLKLKSVSHDKVKAIATLKVPTIFAIAKESFLALKVDILEKKVMPI